MTAIVLPLLTRSPFTVHGIDHLSPSSLNLFAAAKAVWVMERLCRRTVPVGSAAHRGSAVEAGVTAGLQDLTLPLADCIALAEQIYRMRTALSGDPRREKNGESIPGTVEQALAELRPYGTPERIQGRVEHRVDGLAVPIIGHFDFYWPNHGVIIDLKTTAALPSSIKTSHARQVALYTCSTGSNLDARLTYATPKKVTTYRLENARKHLTALENIARAVERFLSLSDDPLFLAGLEIPDVESFYLADPAARQNAFELFGV